jgi:hypothetical protein
MVSTIGITVHKHYCENELVETSFLPHGEEGCCDTDMPVNTNECSDEHQHFNVDSPLVLGVANIELTPIISWVATPYFTAELIQSELNLTPKFYADVNPPPSEPNIYTKVQSFLL